MVSSYVGENDEFERQMLVWRIGRRTHSARYVGRDAVELRRLDLPAVYTPAGYGTEVAEGKETT